MIKTEAPPPLSDLEGWFYIILNSILFYIYSILVLLEINKFQDVQYRNGMREI